MFIKFFFDSISRKLKSLEPRAKSIELKTKETYNKVGSFFKKSSQLYALGSKLKSKGFNQMKKVSDLKIGDSAIVAKVTAQEPIKGRLTAMGIVKGAKLRVLKHTLAKQTWDVMAGSTKVGLREEEAQNILVKVDK